MATAFGGFQFETPLEAQQRLRQEMQKRVAMSMQQGTPGQQFGASLAAMFGPTVRKTLETYQARKTLRQQLEEQGMTEDEAKEQAKQQIERGTHAVRQAKATQAVMADASQEADARIAEGMDPAVARLFSIRRAASKFSSMGRVAEATQLRELANQTLQDIQDRRLEQNKLLADTRNVEARTAELDEPRDQLLRMQEERDTLQAAVLENPNDSNAIRRLDEVSQQIDNMLLPPLGATETDAERLGLHKTTKKDLEKNLLEADDSLSRLDSVASNFDAGFLTLSGRLQTAWTKAKDLAGVDVPPEEKQRFVQAITFRRNAVSNLNLYIKQITGAQMSEAEATRLRKGVPDPEKDGPTEFIAKYNSTLRELEGVRRRAKRALETGDMTLIEEPLTNFINTDTGQAQEQDPASPEQQPWEALGMSREDYEASERILNQ